MTYVISDLHGCFYTLQKLLDKIYIKDSDSQLVFVGDYIDRGLHSKEVVDLVINLQLEGAVCLRGNHDDVVGWILNEESVSYLREFISGELTRNSVTAWWFVNGLGVTISSYVPNVAFESDFKFVDSFIKSVPQSHKEFFRNLKLHWQNDTHFACHAYANPSEKDLTFPPKEVSMEALWSRFSYETKFNVPSGISRSIAPVWDKIGVFGHTPTTRYGSKTPIKHGQIRLIDTGAFMGNYLTAYCVEQDDWLLQATDSRDIP
jgi:serine/threonine protein phosphatase 1